MKTIFSAAILMVALSAPGLADFDSGMAAYSAGDDLAALAAWQPLADDGHAYAQYSIGMLHHEGRGLREIAAHAWRKVAAHRHAALVGLLSLILFSYMTIADRQIRVATLNKNKIAAIRRIEKAVPSSSNGT